ncbi:MAG: adenosylmethionine decarboxylase [Lentisphaeria bacterium]|nr:adenosylmethionine decarboxylase [Lentisphaeria bacterium]
MCTEHSKINHDFALGRQMTVEYYECDPQILADGQRLEKVFLDAAVKSGAHVISSNFHSFEPQGVSGVVIISESHFTVHAWPEHDYAAVDIFTCGENIDFDIAIKTLQYGMGADSVIVSSVMNRGIVSNNGMERFVPVYEDCNYRYSLSWERRFNATAAGGISCSIDIYGIFGNDGFEVGNVRDFVLSFLIENTLFAETSSISNYQLCENEQEMMVFYIEDGMKNCCARFFPQENKVYMDIFSPQFFEPRPVAELAVRLLNGKNYRMQAAIRQ